MPSVDLCAYCLDREGNTLDHLVPYSYFGKVPSRKRRGGKDPGETISACIRCNSILGSKLFPTFEDRRNYVRDKLGLFRIENYLSNISVDNIITIPEPKVVSKVVPNPVVFKRERVIKHKIIINNKETLETVQRRIIKNELEYTRQRADANWNIFLYKERCIQERVTILTALAILDLERNALYAALESL